MHNQPAQTAIVTGAASGMGRSVVMALTNAGLEVLAADLNVSAATETAQMATYAGGRAVALEVDVSSSTSVAGLFAQARRKIDRLDLLVHAAAVMGKTAALEDITDEDWHGLWPSIWTALFFAAAKRCAG